MRAVRGSMLLVALLLALSANAACAAALGSFATSLGVFAALAALFVIKGWPAHVPPAALSTAGTALLVAGAAAWFWRARWGARTASLVASPPPGRRRPAPPPAALIELPADFDRGSLLAELRGHFVRLQEAWDRGDAEALERLATPDMLAELRHELPVFEAAMRAGKTEIVTLSVELRGFERLGQDLLVSAEFSGLMRESALEGAVPFREFWLLTRANDAVGAWRLARHQALL